MDENAMTGVVMGGLFVLTLVLFITKDRRKDNIFGSLRSQITPVKSAYIEILKKYFPFYKRLNAVDQKKFEKKLHQFIAAKKFIPRDIEAITPEMKTLIAAAAVQLTFGLPKVYLSHFKRILVYPDSYYSTINRTYHKGEVNPRYGMIVLSWKNFVEGYIDCTDSMNLGLHEMAHALRFENLIKNGEHNFFDPNTLAEWERRSTQIVNDMAAGRNSFFRDYAMTNREEFFAVAVENFFERPEGFQEAMPKLYRLMCKLLNQDPVQLYQLNK
ncbi:MAG: zinc-dependent peptidase [Bacteroidota bacterium]